MSKKTGEKIDAFVEHLTELNKLIEEYINMKNELKKLQSLYETIYEQACMIERNEELMKHLKDEITKIEEQRKSKNE